jgi:low affinity Fe/Cu permease
MLVIKSLHVPHLSDSSSADLNPFDANGFPRSGTRPMATAAPHLKDEIMFILHDAVSSRYSVEPSSTTYRGDSFERISLWVVRSAGGRQGFCFASLLIIAWVAAGPLLHFHQSWTTGFSVVTSTVTFLLVFFIQHVQNRESKAVHLKLDELIYAAKNARNELISIEHLTEEQLDHLSRRYVKLAGHYQNALLASDGSHLLLPRDRPSLILTDSLNMESTDSMPS